MNYKDLWNTFIDSGEGSDFEEKTGVTIQMIKRVGIKKFIRANDWKSREDVFKWRTDALHVIPCPHCSQDFGVLDDTLGLCDRCFKLYDLSLFYADVYGAAESSTVISENGEVASSTASGDIDPEKVGRSLAFFLVDKQLRRKYMKK